VRAQSTTRNRGREAGIALLISIFILLLISVVAIALIVASGTESSLAGNYRSATGVYYASLAGLEEARGRLLAKDPNSFKNTASYMLPPPGTTFDIGYASYVLNPGPTEIAANILTTYPDNEYASEFGVPPVPANINTTLSIWDSNPLKTLLNLPGPLYKWVRINAVSEKSMNLLVAPSYSAPYDSTTPVFYDGTRLNISGTGAQVLEITALAVLPNGSQKTLQYLVAPVPMNLPNFPAAITFAGNKFNATLANSLNYGGPEPPPPPPPEMPYYVNGTDSFRHSLSDTPSWACNPTAPTVYALGYTNTFDNSLSNIKCCHVLARPNHYIGAGGITPNVFPVAMPPSLQTPTDYNNLVQSIIQNADVILTPGSGTTPAPYTAYGSDLSTATTGMNSSNPMTIVIQGDLDLNGWHNEGYGLLLVTGTLNYDPDASWYGIVLVIGKGQVTGSKGGSGEFDGAVLLAETVDQTTGLPLASLGPAHMEFDVNMGGKGFYYSSCWINNSLPSASYKILSFHEISQ
jgi:hypothetical protein